ncbi:hypothetical protein JW998_02845 [candidate division KSB1 bacterium]|nr:hypothetical protein [candidate division KSB1 bacterium]
MSAILAIDIGTTGLKMAVYRSAVDMAPQKQYAEAYHLNIYNRGLFADIDPEKWLAAFQNGCRALQPEIADVEIIALSGTTPALTAMAENGTALYPAILMLDQRSRVQAQFIIDAIGPDYLFEHTGNMPVAGGCSLASILWIKENLPDIYRKTATFGHSNTFFAKWLTGRSAIDPSSASLSALYNTVKNDMTWNESIARACGLSIDRLPEIMPAAASVGVMKNEIAHKLGFRMPPQVLIGGNDAVLAAYSAGIQSPGDIINVNGTCEITMVCLQRCIPSPAYNVRAHVSRARWLTLHVMNAGGIAYDWFKKTFCADLSDEDFFSRFIGDAIDEWLAKTNEVVYTPYLMGSRYSLEPLTARLEGLTAESTRPQILAAVIKGLCDYQKKHLQQVSAFVNLDHIIHVTGGAVNEALIKAKQKWMWPAEYRLVDQSSMRGAALLGFDYARARNERSF